MSTIQKSIDPDEARRRLYELEKLFDLGHRYARIKRRSLMPDGSFETDGEHALSLALIATAYAMKYRQELDPYKVFFYAVMHDIDEFLYGDVSTIGATKETFAKKDREEAEAAKERRNILAAFPEFCALTEELSNLDVSENAYGKAFDKLAPGYTHRQHKGEDLKKLHNVHSYEELIEAVRSTDEKMLRYAAEFVDVIAMRQESHRTIFDTP